MRGTNAWSGSGNVGRAIRFDKTKEGEECCSFMLAIDNGKVTTWIRVNIFGKELVAICKDKLHMGIYVVIHGELMNRKGSADTTPNRLTEVRAEDIVFIKSNAKPVS